MAIILKADTQVIVRIGPFVDVGDGFTPETSITLGAADEAELLKNNGVTTVSISGNTWAGIANCDGWYNLTLTADNLDTEGELVVVVQDDTVCLPVYQKFQVVSEKVYDSLYGTDGTDTLEVDVIAVSGDTTAAVNLEAQFEDSPAGLTGDNYPATQSQLANITNVGAATNTTPDSYTLTTGTQSSGTIASVVALDGTNHEHTDTAGTMELYYEFLIGAGTPVSATVTGYVNNNNDDIEVFGYDWVGTAWVQIGTLLGKVATTNEVNSYDLFTTMVGTGANLGKVRIRFQSTGLTSATLAVDQIFVSFATGTSVYDDGAVWIDTGASNTNTVSGVDGVATNPVSTIAAANTLATNLNLNRFRIAPGSSITFGAVAQADQVFIGDQWTLALGSVTNMAGTKVMGATVSGVMAGTGTDQVFMNCMMGATSLIKDTRMIECGIAGTQTAVEAGDIFFDRCHSAIAGNNTWVFDFGGALGNTNLNVRNYSGGIQLENMNDAGTDTASIEGQGNIIEGTCTGGAVTCRGIFTTSGITNITMTEGARIDFTGADVATGGPPAAAAHMTDKLNWLFGLSRNKRTTTSTTNTLLQDDGATAAATSAHSDDGTTYTRNEWGA